MIKEIKNRYGTPRYFKKEGKNTYLVWGESYYMRGGSGYIDFEGGPFICLNTPISEFIKRTKGVITAIEPAGIEDLPNCYKLKVE